MSVVWTQVLVETIGFYFGAFAFTYEDSAVSNNLSASIAGFAAAGIINLGYYGNTEMVTPLIASLVGYISLPYVLQWLISLIWGTGAK